MSSNSAARFGIVVNSRNPHAVKQQVVVGPLMMQELLHHGRCGILIQRFIGLQWCRGERMRRYFSRELLLHHNTGPPRRFAFANGSIPRRPADMLDGNRGNVHGAAMAGASEYRRNKRRIGGGRPVLTRRRSSHRGTPSLLITNIPTATPVIERQLNVVTDKLGSASAVCSGWLINSTPGRSRAWSWIEYSFDESQQLQVPGDWKHPAGAAVLLRWVGLGTSAFRGPGPGAGSATSRISAAPLTTYRIPETARYWAPGWLYAFTSRLRAARGDDNDPWSGVDNTLDLTTVLTRRTDWWQYGGLTLRA